MEKCSSENHKEIDALYFCGECKIYMCNKCVKNHSELFKNHNQIKLEKSSDKSILFTGICEEKNHKDELKYFCKIHNILCCAECIAKLKDKENGQHSDCDICFIEDIEKEKRLKLKDNIKYLEDISIDLNDKINAIKLSYEKIEKSKEELKIHIQNIFTKIRNALNNREDELLEELDKKYNELYVNEEMIKTCDKLPNKIKILLGKGKEIENNFEQKNNKLNLLINNCLNIEKNIKEIKLLNENIDKAITPKIDLKFYPEEKELNELLDNIKILGKIGKLKEFDSKIQFDKTLIESWLNHKNFYSILLFRKSRDGSTPNDFHNKCDNKGITITFIETTKGYKFGGYTELPWDISEKSKRDQTTFIFSFNNKQKYEARNKNDSISCAVNEGPTFGCDYPEIYLEDSLDKGESFDSSNCTFIRNRVLTNGEKNWEVKELEVHKIVYI